MIGEQHAYQVVTLSFMPVGDSPDATDRWNFGKFTFLIVLPPRDNNLQFEAVFEFDAGQLIDHLDMWFVVKFFGFLLVGFQVIATTEIVQVIETKAFIIAQKSSNCDDLSSVHLNPRIDSFKRSGTHNGLAEFLQED